MISTACAGARGPPTAAETIKQQNMAAIDDQGWMRSGDKGCRDENGMFRLEMPQIVPAFGQPHGHLAYDSGDYETVFLRPVMGSARDTSLEAHFVLQPA